MDKTLQETTAEREIAQVQLAALQKEIYASKVVHDA